MTTKNSDIQPSMTTKNSDIQPTCGARPFDDNGFRSSSAFISVTQDGWTGGIQLSICDENGSGFRLHGPKFNGSGKTLVEHKLTRRDADEIQSYLDDAFPPDVRELEQENLELKAVLKACIDEMKYSVKVGQPISEFRREFEMSDKFLLTRHKES